MGREDSLWAGRIRSGQSRYKGFTLCVGKRREDWMFSRRNVSLWAIGRNNTVSRVYFQGVDGGAWSVIIVEGSQFPTEQIYVVPGLSPPRVGRCFHTGPFPSVFPSVSSPPLSLCLLSHLPSPLYPPLLCVSLHLLPSLSPPSSPSHSLSLPLPSLPPLPPLPTHISRITRLQIHRVTVYDRARVIPSRCLSYLPHSQSSEP